MIAAAAAAGERRKRWVCNFQSRLTMLVLLNELSAISGRTHRTQIKGISTVDPSMVRYCCIAKTAT